MFSFQSSDTHVVCYHITLALIAIFSDPTHASFPPLVTICTPSHHPTLFFLHPHISTSPHTTMSSTSPIDEKQVAVSTEASHSDGYQSDIERDWNDDEEKKLVRK